MKLSWFILFLFTISLHSYFICAEEPTADNEPIAALAWFTDAEIQGAVKTAKSADSVKEVVGASGKGIHPDSDVAIENPLLSQAEGMISFWICPEWNGNDGKIHKILRIGDVEKNGLLVEKNAAGMFRFVMASPAKSTSSRYDISDWKAGEWHHVAVSWFSFEGKPCGLPLWIDKVAVDGPITGGNEFINPEKIEDKRLYLGDETTQAVIDELIIRKKLDAEGGAGQLAIVYRDYFHTAPFKKIEITHEALRVRSDRRVVNGHEKQFGLLAELEGKMIPVTDFAVRYGQWADFDAKPLVKWSTSNNTIATVDANGRMTGKSVGKCILTAEFRGMKDKYNIEVVPLEQPDLDILYIERLPRYSWKQAKQNPADGDTVQSVVHIENYGFKNAPAGVDVLFELIPDTNKNFILDKNERAVSSQTGTIEKALAPRERTNLTFEWKWQSEPIFVRVTVDQKNKVPEFCEVNNERCDLNIARPMRMAYNPERLEAEYKEKKINHIGSFSYHDWICAQMERCNVMLRETILPSTSPVGIQEALRVDNFYILEGGKWEKEPYVVNDEYYDGGFPVNEPVDLMAIDAAILHEFGHTCLALPDLYGYPQRPWNILLKDENGNFYTDTPLLPRLAHDLAMLPSACSTPCGVGYSPLMHNCHLWLHPANAGKVQYYIGYRGPKFWGVQGRHVATQDHILQVCDINDEPLRGAAVYVYHCTQTGAQSGDSKYFADRPKFKGNTNDDGCYLFPNVTDADWDDPDTDEVEKEYKVWNPFGRANTITGAIPDIAFTPNVWQVEGLLLLKIVSGEQVEFRWLPLTEMNDVFYQGNKIQGIYPIRTSLKPSAGITPLVKQDIPDAIKEKNLKPIAVVPTELTLKAGKEFTIDGSKSSDPEGQPLYYRWNGRGRGISPWYSSEPIYKGKLTPDAADIEIVFWVIDGLRTSEAVFIKVKVEKPEEKPADVK